MGHSTNCKIDLWIFQFPGFAPRGGPLILRHIFNEIVEIAKEHKATSDFLKIQTLISGFVNFLVSLQGGTLWFQDIFLMKLLKLQRKIQQNQIFWKLSNWHFDLYPQGTPNPKKKPNQFKSVDFVIPLPQQTPTPIWKCGFHSPMAQNRWKT